jgi:flagellar assembly factor FliW
MTETTTDVMAARRAASFAEKTVIDFADGLPGLGDARSWKLFESEEIQPLLWLRCLERPGLSLLLIDPRLIAPEYRPQLPKAQLARIGFEGDHPVLVLVVVALHEESSATANLRAPIIVDVETMKGMQVILEDDDLPMRYPLDAASQHQQEWTGRSESCSSSAERPVSQS